MQKMAVTLVDQTKRYYKKFVKSRIADMEHMEKLNREVANPVLSTIYLPFFINLERFNDVLSSKKKMKPFLS